eukprot:scaffold97176_cov42-Phaeocystis_antarctica.AAC.1
MPVCHLSVNVWLNFVKRSVTSVLSQTWRGRATAAATGTITAGPATTGCCGPAAALAPALDTSYVRTLHARRRPPRGRARAA